ncbi:MAG: hypothetical protein ACM336_16480 [Acidobacteriota bacterium]
MPISAVDTDDLRQLASDFFRRDPALQAAISRELKRRTGARGAHRPAGARSSAIGRSGRKPE